MKWATPRTAVAVRVPPSVAPAGLNDARATVTVPPKVVSVLPLTSCTVAITAKGAKFRHMVHAEAHLNDGTVLKRTVEAGRGSEKNFASDADVVAKFEKLAAKALPKAQIAKLRDAMLSLEKLADASELARLLQKA